MRRGLWRIDSQELARHLAAEDDLGVVIRGHLALENALNTLLEVGLPAGLTNLAGLRFPARLDLAIATGLLDRAARDAWLLINELRNRFAHDLDAALDESTAEEVERCLALRPEKREGVIYRPPARPGTPRERVGWAMMALWADALEGVTIRQPREPETGEWE